MMKCRIGDIRRKKGLQQNFVAEQLKMSQQYLSEIENNKRDPRASTLFKIATLLNCTVDELYDYKEE